MWKNDTVVYQFLMERLTKNDVEKDALDISILTYILNRTNDFMSRLDPQACGSLPLVSYLNEPGAYVEREHRIVVYTQPQLARKNVHFVGFLSKRQSFPQTDVSASIAEADRKIVMELAPHSGLLSYSSLKLFDEIWYNLVLFVPQDRDVKESILAMKTHQHAAYELAPYYYEWIRLHHGVVAENDLSNSLILHKTKYYAFHPGTQQPTIHVQTYHQDLEFVSA